MYANRRNTQQAQRNTLNRKDQKPRREEARHQRDESARHRLGENRGRPKNSQRQERELLVNAENDPIKEIDTIMGGPYVEGESKNAKFEQYFLRG